MPITVWIDPRQRLVAARGLGIVTDQDVFTYQASVWQRPDVAGYTEVVDMTDAEAVRTTSAERTEDLARVASGMDPWNTPSRLAIVAPGDTAFQLSHQYAQWRERLGGRQKRVGVFRSRAEAEQWLGMAPGTITHLFATPPS